MSNFDDIFELGAAQVFDYVHDASVQLQRGSDSSSAFDATWYGEEYQLLDHETGLSIAVHRRTYVLKASLCVINAATVTPREGDRIVDGTDTLVVLPIDGKPAVENIPGGYRFKVRTDKLA